MPPFPPPPAEAWVGMSAAAPMAATVATAKIVLRIMGLSSFFLDVFAHPACQSGEPTGGFNGAPITVRVSVHRRFRFSGPVALGVASAHLAVLGRHRYKPPRSYLLSFSSLEERCNGDRAYLFDHQTRRHSPQFDRRDQRHDRAGRLAYRRAKAHAHQP